MEFKAFTTTFKDFLNNNPIKWENFLNIQLNQIELKKRKRKECLDDTHTEQA
jgi:hypothetical protein